MKKFKELNTIKKIIVIYIAVSIIFAIVFAILNNILGTQEFVKILGYLTVLFAYLIIGLILVRALIYRIKNKETGKVLCGILFIIIFIMLFITMMRSLIL
ncbi:MAG: hypothetical protein SPD90_00940 [Intestinibacter sp.]|uniref:hypothetical protein n=1 Tax=Intestinibacter sp. TaxID=1965304 RepID=UPI002A7F5AED|nr:hypothetical protein [Intestinibacter sp.]MDY4573604.1 hypothetical protein [Intestinibacter sp.]